MNRGIKNYVDSLPVASDHEHHLPDDWFDEGMTLDRAMARAYVQWTGFKPDGTEASRRELLDNVRFNSYYVWFERGVQAIHNIPEPITLENWDSISRVVAKSYENPRFHIDILKRCGYERIIQDAYWNPGDDMGHPEILIPAFRVDKFMHGHHKECVTLDEFDVWKRYRFSGGTLDDYVEMMKRTIRARHTEGKVAALKCADAYLRPIDFQPDDRPGALSAFGKHPNDITPEEKRLFGNYIFNRACDLAAELDVPFQIHTGLGDLRGSNPMLLEPTIARHPKTRFVLFHSGYPWLSQVGALSHNYGNVCPSLTWTATISTEAAVRALDEYIDVSSSINRITWGGDSHVPEDSVGALLAWKHIVARVLTRRLNDGVVTPSDADRLAEKLMYGNVKTVYRLG
mgnify:CR=1 FL=1